MGAPPAAAVEVERRRPHETNAARSAPTSPNSVAAVALAPDALVDAFCAYSGLGHEYRLWGFDIFLGEFTVERS
jgi:hypothetical protein